MSWPLICSCFHLMEDFGPVHDVGAQLPLKCWHSNRQFEWPCLERMAFGSKYIALAAVCSRSIVPHRVQMGVDWSEGGGGGKHPPKHQNHCSKTSVKCHRVWQILQWMRYKDVAT